MKIFIGILLCIPFLLFSGVRVYKNINFNIKCEGRLKRAADANTVKLAKQEVKVALDYLEMEKMTEGYTSIVYRTPDEDVEFWYQNLKQSMDELEKITSKTTQLERSNMLMKLRETLLDDGIVTIPVGMSIFPNNSGYAIIGSVFFLMFFAGAVMIMCVIDFY